MKIERIDIQYSPIRKYNYKQWFEVIKYTDKTLSEEEKKGLVHLINQVIDEYSSGLPLAYNILEDIKDKKDTFHMIDRVVVSVMLFVQLTMIDSIVACKYFVLADKDYDKRYMRGKLMVILNEGFKRLYGFDNNTYKKSEWDRLLPLLGHFPEKINLQYQELTSLLENHAKSSSWWREERNLETHLEAEKLYVSRQDKLIEGKVITDSMKLFSTLQAVSNFLTNVHACLCNYLVDKYLRGEIKEE